MVGNGGYIMTRLYTDDLSIGYGDQLIVKNLSVKIPDKKITTIIGPNGCGKSTLLKAITRIISYQSGKVILDGESINVWWDIGLPWANWDVILLNQVGVELLLSDKSNKYMNRE